MKKIMVFSIFMALILLGIQTLPVAADGIVIILPCEGIHCPPPDRPDLPMRSLDIRYHNVQVKIDNQVAVTRVDQVFHNPNDREVEGIYIFPLPLNATIQRFVLWINGKPVEGKVLDAEQARQTYEDITRRMKDPALLEYVGRGAFQASIYPIPPNGDRRIEIEYSQPLVQENGLVTYTYPLNTEKFSRIPLENVNIKVEALTSQPVRAVYSSTHNIQTTKVDDKHFIANFQAANVLPDTDFTLQYSIGETEAFHMLSFRDPSDAADPDGYFLMLLAPKPGLSTDVIAKDMILVLDHSGSMDGEKITQAKEAARFVLNRLNKDDRFFLTLFNENIDMFSKELSPATRAGEAIDWMDRFGAEGNTDINRALLESIAAIGNTTRPVYLIFLTDGLPTEGVVETGLILNNIATNSPKSLRLFPFGVGYDVDTMLLDTLSQEHHGASTYVTGDESLQEMISTFYKRISTPLLSDLKLNFSPSNMYDIYPAPLPDLFTGSQAVILGRYKKGGTVNVTLEGMVNGEIKKFEFPTVTLAEDSRKDSGSQAALPRLWAARKIGYLERDIRLKGANKEMIDQIIRLSIRFGIVTPYTSYLVTEEAMPMSVDEQKRAAAEAYDMAVARPTMPAAGPQAIATSQAQGNLAQSEALPAQPAAEAQHLQNAGSRTFIFRDETWIDTTFDEKTMQKQTIVFLSPEYFELLNRDAEIKAALSLGDHVIIVIDKMAYEITPEAKVKITPDVSATPVANIIKPEDTNPEQMAANTSASNDGIKKIDSSKANSILTPAAFLLIAFGLILTYKPKGRRPSNKSD